MLGSNDDEPIHMETYGGMTVTSLTRSPCLRYLSILEAIISSDFLYTLGSGTCETFGSAVGSDLAKL